MRTVIWVSAGVLGLIVIVGVAGLIFLKTAANGFSARADPSALETMAAKIAQKLALPAGAGEKQNPTANSREVLEEAMAHWADHCAVCHSNDGSGQMQMGHQMYPHAPDMRKEETQKFTDGELFYIIENGIRLTGMPAWGGTKAGEEASWKLVRFIRHLPQLSAQEIAQMERLNPKSPEDFEQEQRAEQFLNGQTPAEATKQHKH